MRAADVVSLVKLEHTVFALPFAYAGMLFALHIDDRVLTAAVVLWITVAMVGARSLAMALNRLIDAEIDGRNPRTADREIPSGKLTRTQVLGICIAGLALLLVAVSQLDPITRWLWPIPVALFVLYPYTKRFTWLCHLVLGLSIGLAPLGAWLAVSGEAPPAAWALVVAIATWIGGFDIIYATTDVEFDRAAGLNSLPARFGVGPALLVTRVLHCLTCASLLFVGLDLQLGVVYFVGLVVVALLLAYENAIVRAHDLSRVNAAFFTTNGIIAVIYVIAVAADLA